MQPSVNMAATHHCFFLIHTRLKGVAEALRRTALHAELRLDLCEARLAKVAHVQLGGFCNRDVAQFTGREERRSPQSMSASSLNAEANEYDASNWSGIVAVSKKIIPFLLFVGLTDSKALSMPERVLIVGSSGHASSVIDTVERTEAFHIIGLLDRFKPKGSRAHGFEIFGGEDEIQSICAKHHVDAVVVAMGDNWGRSQSVRMLRERVPGLKFMTVIHPSATVSHRAAVGCGTVVMAGAIVNANCSVGDFCIVNTKASLDHECVLEDLASVAPGATLGGNVRVGAFSAVCLSANIIHNCRVGEHTVLGAGSTLLNHLPDHVVAYGVPARVVRKRETGEPYLDAIGNKANAEVVQHAGA
jgi:sugar O-acyltransferase (sialic acid O-acetyltransferase NeuD family)